MNTSSKRGRLVIIAANANHGDETENDVFKLDLLRRKNDRKFLVLRNKKKELVQRNKFKIRSQTTGIFKNDLNTSTKALNNLPEKEKAKLLSLSVNSHSSEDARNMPSFLSCSVSNCCEETCEGETSRCFQGEVVCDRSRVFYSKRKAWPKFNNEECQNVSLPQNNKKSYSRAENLSWMQNLSQRKMESNIYTRDALELRRNFHNLAKQLKHCETDEDKSFIIIEIVLYCLKGPFNHLCNKAIPKLILMIEEMCQNEESKLCCSIALYALIKTELISNYSDVSTLVMSLLKTDISPNEKQQKSKGNFKIQKHLNLLNHLEESENLEVFKQYTASDFAVDCILKFSSYCKTDNYKSELRYIGSLDIILDIVNFETLEICSEKLPSKIQLYNIIKLEHCLNILQNVIFRTPDNQSYVSHYKNFQILKNLTSILQFIQRKCTPEFGKSFAVEHTKCLSSALKLLIDITHKNIEGSIFIEKQREILDIVLFFLISLPLSNQEADIVLLLLGITANLIMTSRRILCRFTTFKVKYSGLKHEVNATVALSEMFHNLYMEAQKLEASTENLFNRSTTWNCDSAAFHSVGRHLEHSMMCSFLALIVGYVIEHDRGHAYLIKNTLPDLQFDNMATVLKEFHDFVHHTDFLESVDMEEIQRIVDILMTV